VRTAVESIGFSKARLPNVTRFQREGDHYVLDFSYAKGHGVDGPVTVVVFLTGQVAVRPRP
jgi:hypothetical protein